MGKGTDFSVIGGCSSHIFVARHVIYCCNDIAVGPFLNYEFR